MKTFLLITLSMLLAGCAGVQTVAVKAHKKNSASFLIGQLQEKTVGEPMVVEETLYFITAPVGANEYRPPSQGGSTYPLITEGMVFTPYGMLDNGDVLYTSRDFRPTFQGKSVKWDYCIAVNSSGVAYGDAACALGLIRKWADSPGDVIEMKPVYREGSEKRVLVYNGKLNNILKLTYLEYRVDFRVPAIQQELTYDLSESKTLKFKKMSIDIAEASSSTIKFTVNSNMDGATSVQNAEDILPDTNGPNPADAI